MKSLTLEQHDRVSTKLNQLHALLVSVTGTGYESFSELAPLEQQNLLWLASDLARQARNTFHSQDMEDRVTGEARN